MNKEQRPGNQVNMQEVHPGVNPKDQSQGNYLRTVSWPTISVQGLSIKKKGQKVVWTQDKTLGNLPGAYICSNQPWLTSKVWLLHPPRCLSDPTWCQPCRTEAQSKV